MYCCCFLLAYVKALVVFRIGTSIEPNSGVGDLGIEVRFFQVRVSFLLPSLIYQAAAVDVCHPGVEILDLVWGVCGDSGEVSSLGLDLQAI